jgi:protein gp37
MGVSVENEQALHRVEDKRVRASVRFLSCEPLIGPLNGLDLKSIQWVIVGGESGPNSRHMDPAWVQQIYDTCRQAGVPFFFKQWGGVRKELSGRKFRGKTYDEMPLVN